MSYFILPIFILLVLLFALKNKVNAYDAFIKGAKSGFKTSIDILPYFLAMVMASTIFQASQIMVDLIKLNGFPKELILQGFFRPLSGNASLSIMIKVYETYGVDSKISLASSLLQGSTDTTLYVVTLYFGAINMVKYRYALKLGLLIDFMSLIVAITAYYFIF